MKRLAPVLSLSLVGALAMIQSSSAADAAVSASLKANPASPLNQAMKTLDGQDVNPAEKYAGQVVLLVNVASKCGLTPQYKELEALHEKYADQGLAIVGVPCNQFNGQEPGSAEEIATFCSTKYGVEFDLLSKVDVNGENACPLYKSLTSEETNPKSPGPIQWNFEKFLFNRQGELVARFAPRVTPDAPEVVAAIEAQLATQ
ncbi:MAG: glutathione peroxidase [Pirellulales bacterium]